MLTDEQTNEIESRRAAKYILSGLDDVLQDIDALLAEVKRLREELNTANRTGSCGSGNRRNIRDTFIVDSGD